METVQKRFCLDILETRQDRRTFGHSETKYFRERCSFTFFNLEYNIEVNHLPDRVKNTETTWLKTMQNYAKL